MVFHKQKGVPHGTPFCYPKFFFIENFIAAL